MCRPVWTLVLLVIITVARLEARGPLSSSCHSDADCATKNAHCKNGICECRLQFVLSQRRDTCLTASNMGGACNETEQCFSMGELGVCQQHICTCVQGSWWDTKNEECISSGAGRITQLSFTIMTAVIVFLLYSQGCGRT